MLRSVRFFMAVPTIILHTLTIPNSFFLFLHVKRPNQQMKTKVNKDSIKHSHKSGIHIKTTELPLKILMLVSLVTSKGTAGQQGPRALIFS